MNKKSIRNTPNYSVKPLNGSDNNTFIQTEDSADKITEKKNDCLGFGKLLGLLCLSVCYVTSGENRTLS